MSRSALCKPAFAGSRHLRRPDLPLRTAKGPRHGITPARGMTATDPHSRRSARAGGVDGPPFLIAASPRPGTPPSGPEPSIRPARACGPVTGAKFRSTIDLGGRMNLAGQAVVTIWTCVALADGADQPGYRARHSGQQRWLAVPGRVRSRPPALEQHQVARIRQQPGK